MESIERSSAGRAAELEYQLKVDDEDFVGKVVATTGRPYECALLEVSLALCEPTATIVDVGAFIGNHSVYWALAGHGHVVAIEPSPSSFAMLSFNCVLDSVESAVTLHECAVGHETASVSISYPERNRSAARLVHGATGPLEQKRLDDLALDRFTLLKIDVEGMESAVLAGARVTLDRHRPTIWIEALTAQALTKCRLELGAQGYGLRPIAIDSTNYLFFPTLGSVLRAAVRPNGGKLLMRVARATTKRTIRRLARRLGRA